MTSRDDFITLITIHKRILNYKLAAKFCVEGGTEKVVIEFCIEEGTKLFSWTLHISLTAAATKAPSAKTQMIANLYEHKRGEILKERKVKKRPKSTIESK
jgi:hypothetical protein